MIYIIAWLPALCTQTFSHRCRTCIVRIILIKCRPRLHLLIVSSYCAWHGRIMDDDTRSVSMVIYPVAPDDIRIVCYAHPMKTRSSMVTYFTHSVASAHQVLECSLLLAVTKHILRNLMLHDRPSVVRIKRIAHRINSKVEVQHARITGVYGCSFFTLEIRISLRSASIFITQ